MPIVNILALVIPALLGAVAGIGFGHRAVRQLRVQTGDDSSLTNVLSGDFLRAHEDHQEPA